MKTFMGTVGNLDRTAHDRILAQLDPNDVRTIDESLPSVWLPIQVNVDLTDATSRELGQHDAHAFYRRMVMAEYETNTFKAFVASVGRLFGFSPSSYVKMAPRGWELVFKDCGVFRAVEHAPRSARLEYTKIPRACMQNPLWIESVRSSFYTAFDISRMDGEITWDELDFGAQRAVFRFSW